MSVALFTGPRSTPRAEVEVDHANPPRCSEDHRPWSDPDDADDGSPDVDDDTLDAPVEDAPKDPSLAPAPVPSGLFGAAPLVIFALAASVRVGAGILRHEGPTVTLLGLSASIWISLWLVAGELVYRWTDTDL